jgi:hypothetical protein
MTKANGEGLDLSGPLSRTIPTIKVAFRPQSRLLEEKVKNAILRLKEGGVTFGTGSFASVRTMEGFCHFPNIHALTGNRSELENNSFTVIDHDPCRRSFCISGEGEGTIALEISWFCLRAFTEDVLVIGLPTGDGKSGNVPEGTQERLEHYLGLLKEWKTSRKVASSGYSLYRGSDLKVTAEQLTDERK